MIFPHCYFLTPEVLFTTALILINNQFSTSVVMKILAQFVLQIWTKFVEQILTMCRKVVDSVLTAPPGLNA